jgi:K+-transporting ATPase ATPase C chain
MWKQIARAAIILIAMTIIVGVTYPLAVTGLSQLVFPRQANGSLVQNNGETVGSALIGQNFTAPGYFHGRPSAAGKGYDPTASGGSNLGPTSRELIKAVKDRVKQVRQENNLPDSAPVPADLVTASGSGLDPDISPQAALLQVTRVARARKIPEDTVRNLVKGHITGRQFGFLGEPRVNVLELNLALDRLK